MADLIESADYSIKVSVVGIGEKGRPVQTVKISGNGTQWGVWWFADKATDDEIINSLGSALLSVLQGKKGD